MNTIIHTPCPNLADSLNFYQKLNFQVVNTENPCLLSAGQLVIEINPARFARAGVKLYRTSWKNQLETLRSMTNVLSIDNGYLLCDPSGVWIYLIENEVVLLKNKAETAPSLLGNYAGISLETTHFNASVALWRTLGFDNQQGTVEQGWVSLTNADGATVSLMPPNTCPHLFFNPSLTFFNGKNNPAIIEKIRSLNLPITEEITHFNAEGEVDNIIIRDPGGYGFFLFND
jgi:hypothetical protein